MKAAMIVPGPHGGHLEIQEVPMPTAGAGQVLVQVMASGLNRGETYRVPEAKAGDPLKAGIEFAGIVSQVGSDVHNVREGDRVAGHGWGGQAEFVVAAARALMKMPSTVSWAEAASFVNVFVTAHDALVTNGEFRAGQSVLVNAATGGIGLAAVQLAAALGASQVFATSRSAAKLARLYEYGVTHGIDLSREDSARVIATETEGRGVDIILDSVGGTVFESNVQSLAVRGRLVHMARMGGAPTSQLDLTQLWLKRLKLIGVTFRTRSEEERLACIEACARDVLPLLQAGRIKLPVDRVFRLDELAKAHAYMETDQHFGKIVIAIGDGTLAAAVR